MKKKKNLNVTVDVELFDKIKEIAEEEDRPLSNYVNKVLKEHVGLSKQKTTSRLIGIQ